MRTPSTCFLLVCLWFLSISSSQAELNPVKCQETVDSVADLLEPCSSIFVLSKAKKIQSYNPSTMELRNCMDPQKLLKLLPRLSMQPGYCLDFVSTPGGFARFPVFYPRAVGAEPFQSFHALTNSLPAKAVDSTGKHCVALANKRVLSSYGSLFCQEKLRTDGTEEGFFQLMVFCLMGDQFIHQWHDSYHDDLIICTKAGLDDLFSDVDSGRDEHWKMESGVRQRASTLDFKPSVEMNEKNVTVHIVVFTKWGGFSRRSYVFQRAVPHLLLDGSSKVLVGYHCSWMY